MPLKLEEIYVDNYKSFHKSTIKLDDFNIIVGANNAGKTNLVDLLEFIEIAVKHDLGTAVKYKGGFEKIKNFRNQDDFVEIKAVFKESLFSYGIHDVPKPFYFVENYNGKYILFLKFTRDKKYLSEIKTKSESKIKEITAEEYTVLHNKDEKKRNIHQLLKEGTSFDIDILVRKEVEEIDDAEVVSDFMAGKSTGFEKEEHRNKYKQISLNPGNFGNIKFLEGLLEKKINIEIKNREKGDVEPEYYAHLLNNFFIAEKEIREKFYKGKMSLEDYNNHVESNSKFEDFRKIFIFSDINTFSFDTNAIRKSIKTPQSIALERDGSNLNYILELKKNKDEFEIISASLIGIVDEVEDVEVEKQPMGTDIIREIIFKEKGGFSVARQDISDGTLALLAILTGLYTKLFAYLVAIEEPDRHLHMNAISYLMEVFRSYSKETQLIITTHSSEVIRNVNPDSDNLVFVYRDYDGMSQFISSGDIEEIKAVMEKYEYNVDDIVRNDFLGYLGDYA